jgi:hypothetical protein
MDTGIVDSKNITIVFQNNSEYVNLQRYYHFFNNLEKNQVNILNKNEIKPNQGAIEE